MRPSVRRQRCCHALGLVMFCLVSIQVDEGLAVRSSGSEDEPWLAARMLEIRLFLRSASSVASSVEHSARSPQQELKVRFDALLVGIGDLVSRITQEAPTLLNTTSSSPTPRSAQHDSGGAWENEVEQAVTVAVVDALTGAAEEVYTELEGDLDTAATKGVRGDWLDAADAMCSALVLQRRREIIDLYRHGLLQTESKACSLSQKGHFDPMRCRPGITAVAARTIGVEGGRVLQDSVLSLAACRAFFEASEMEYAKAACLRAARLGNMSIDEAMEVDMRLAAVAFHYGRPPAAVRLYFSLMFRASTDDNGRLALSLMGLTMVPPMLIGSLDTVFKFRAGWIRDLRDMRRNLRAGVMKGNLWDPNAQVGSTPFYLAHQGGPDLELMASLAGVYDVAAPSLRYMAPHCHRGTKDSDERFFSIHLRDHSIGRMMLRLITHLSEMPDFEVHVFGPTNANKGRDHVVSALRSTAQHWHQAPPNLDLARSAVAREELDVLVYPDIGMEPLTYFMAYARLAPIQCVWWGHPVTPSTGAIDYFLSLNAEADDGHMDYMEQLTRMDLMNTAPFQQVGALDEKNVMPRGDLNGKNRASSPPLRYEVTAMDDPPTASTFTAKARAAIVDLDAPVALREEDAATDESGAECLRSYLVLGRLFKLHPKFDLAIEGILAGDVDGCVILIHETRDEEWTRAVWSRLRDSLVPQGLSDRLRIMHHWLYPEALRRVSAVLDTFPYGGCLTVLEALSHGIPVVTLPADFVRGRFAFAIYKQMAYTDLVADDLKGYVSLAIRLGTDEAFRRKAVHSIEGGYRSSLHRHKESADEWGQFFRRAFRLTGRHLT